MRVIMVVIVAVVMRMVVAVVMTAMRIVHMIMNWQRRRRIGAAFRLERCIDQRDFGAKRRQQRLDRFIAPRADAIR